MLIYHSKLLGMPVLSVQTSSPVGYISSAITDPNTLKILAFRLSGPQINIRENILDVNSIREYSSLGLVIDDIDELIAPDDVIKISNVLKLNFCLTNLKVETKKGSKLGKIIDFTVTSEDFIVKQLIVKRPLVKSLTDPELTIPRSEIVEVTDYKVIVKDEEKTIKARAMKEDFIPNFVNPFREPGFASTETSNNKNIKD